MSRPDGRTPGQIRPHQFTPNFSRYADGSVLIECGNTRVICTASVTPGAPRWMREEGKPGGWVTAEYQMLPASTGRRGSRRPNSRATEIQRLIGRCLRASVDMTKLGDHSVYIDCDVLDADGGTRCASINGGMVALSLALSKLFAEGKISTIPIVNPIAAISVGIVDGVPVADLNYIEDSGADVDLNVIMAENGEYVELQGTAEGKTFSRAQMDSMLRLADSAIREILDLQRACLSKR